MKFFPHDTTQHEFLFGNDFTCDFSKWPHEFWVRPKQITTNFRDVISKLKLAIIVPPIIFSNGTKRAWFDIQIRVTCSNGVAGVFQFYKCCVDYDNPHKIEDMLSSALEYKLTKYRELDTIHTIKKIRIRGTTSF